MTAAIAPNEVRDANDILRRKGQEGLRRAWDAASPTRVNGAAVAGKAGGDETDASTFNAKPWPILDSTAAHGLVGEIGKLATRNSEADPVAVMGTALAMGAAAFGRSRYVEVGDTAHHARLFCALVGASSRSRKGTSLDPVKKIYREAERSLQAQSTLPFPSGLPLKMSPGPLSSGEGLIDAIRDKRDDEDTGGVQDKRLLCVEGEFGAVLRACQRQGNNLSTMLRVAWDGWELAPLTKHNKVVATDPHICLIAHVTRQELQALLTTSDIWNGFANRFIWLAVRRRATVPFPTPMPAQDVLRLGLEWGRVIKHAHSHAGSAGRIVMSNSAQGFWADGYAALTQDHVGILGAVTSRAEAQALRLAITFALFDGADRIELQHVEAAVTFWRYAFDSAAYVFGEATLDPAAQKIIAALEAGPLTQTQIVNLFDRHLAGARLGSVLDALQERGRITLSHEDTGGRPRKVWRLAA